ncbi:hypothetical protein QBC39DRAFT_73515 [Podospora conica]|nr:hypothetical protein QBC39DRAFT_73515 [Schizothecium conicum]
MVVQVGLKRCGFEEEGKERASVFTVELDPNRARACERPGSGTAELSPPAAGKRPRSRPAKPGLPLSTPPKLRRHRSPIAHIAKCTTGKRWLTASASTRLRGGRSGVISRWAAGQTRPNSTSSSSWPELKPPDQSLCVCLSCLVHFYFKRVPETGRIASLGHTKPANASPESRAARGLNKARHAINPTDNSWAIYSRHCHSVSGLFITDQTCLPSSTLDQTAGPH